MTGNPVSFLEAVGNPEVISLNTVSTRESWYFCPTNESNTSDAMKNIGDAFNYFAQAVTTNAPNLLDSDITSLDTENSKSSNAFWRSVLSAVKDRKIYNHLNYVKSKKGKNGKTKVIIINNYCL